MRRRLLLESFIAACLISASGCAELLLGDRDYHLAEGGGGDGAGGDGAGDGGGIVPVGCDEGLATCDGACVRLDTDALHCGACNHDCLGSACNAGMCAPEDVVTGVSEPAGLALDETHVYWTTAGGLVQRAPKAGGAAETIASGQNDPGPIVADGKRVIWINRGDGTLLKRKKDGTGMVKVVFDAGEAGGLAHVTDDVDNLYFSRDLAGEIRRAGKESDGVPDVFAGGQPGVTSVHRLGPGLVWAGLDPAGGGYIRLAKKMSGGSLLTLAEGEDDITALIDVAGSAVWADAGGRIRVRPVPEGAVSTLVDGQDVRGLAADADRVIWSTATGLLSARALGSSETRLLAYGIASPGALAVDETHVYVLRTGPSGGVLRVAR